MCEEADDPIKHSSSQLTRKIAYRYWGRKGKWDLLRGFIDLKPGAWFALAKSENYWPGGGSKYRRYIGKRLQL